ncbi:myosin XVA, partial [Homo sapiens]
LCNLLKLCGDHEVMRDECYCQVVKQITDNTSSKQDSCQRGWRLLYIVTAYHSCSEVLHPHLTRFLQDVSRTPGLPFQGIAKACEQNLQKTLRFGGRLELPSSIELRAMLAGRSSKRQLFLLPGGLERHLKIKTCTVALDVVEEICAEMALTRPEAFNEYVIFVVTNRGGKSRSTSQPSSTVQRQARPGSTWSASTGSRHRRSAPTRPVPSFWASSAPYLCSAPPSSSSRAAATLLCQPLASLPSTTMASTFSAQRLM